MFSLRVVPDLPRCEPAVIQNPLSFPTGKGIKSLDRFLFHARNLSTIPIPANKN